MAPVVSRGGGGGGRAMGAKERKEAAQREKEAGDEAYGEELYKRAAAHYAAAADLDPGDTSCLIKRAAANFSMNKCKECVADCDEALGRRRRRDARCGCDEKLAADALFLKALALLNLAVCAADHEPAITALEGSLELRPGSKETRAKLDMAKRNRDAFAEQERLDQEAAKTHRDRGL
jgi:stress-induced-phosphoprotein 1